MGVKKPCGFFTRAQNSHKKLHFKKCQIVTCAKQASKKNYLWNKKRLAPAAAI